MANYAAANAFPRRAGAARRASALRLELAPSGDASLDGSEAPLRQAVASIPIARRRDAGLLDALLRLVSSACRP